MVKPDVTEEDPERAAGTRGLVSAEKYSDGGGVGTSTGSPSALYMTVNPDVAALAGGLGNWLMLMLRRRDLLGQVVNRSPTYVL